MSGAWIPTRADLVRRLASATFCARRSDEDAAALVYRACWVALL